MIILPVAGRGRRSPSQEQEFQYQLQSLAGAILEIRSRLDFEVSSRGWCYLLEEHGLTKGDFDRAQDLINRCRKTGLLPIDICAEDGARTFIGIESIDDPDPEVYANGLWESIDYWVRNYQPVSFWNDKPFYLQMLVEKVDLKSLFEPACRRWAIPTANARGWSDINQRAKIMRRFAQHEKEGRQCVLLYCGDHDPAGLQISETLRSTLAELSLAVGWYPDNLIIDRFGLNADFIQNHRLSWIDNLETGSGRSLADPRHPDHGKEYVQTYLAKYGARKVEANALVTKPAAGRQLCEAAIFAYLNDPKAPERFMETLEPYRQQVRELVQEGRV